MVFHYVDITAGSQALERIWDRADTGWYGEAPVPMGCPDVASARRKDMRIVPAFVAEMDQLPSFLWYLWRIWFILPEIAD